jgi:hypothetical protein
MWGPSEESHEEIYQRTNRQARYSQQIRRHISEVIPIEEKRQKNED